MAGKLIVDLIGIPKAFYFQSADPAIANPTHLRTGIHWIDTTANPYTWKRRNAANDGWDTLGKVRTDAQFNTDVDGRITAANLATDAEVATAISNHEAAANPHPTYLTQAEGDALYAALVGSQRWTINFTDDGDAYIPANVAMTIDVGVAAIGTGTLAYEKSTTAAPDTFASTTLPATLQAGAWLKITVSSLTGFKVVELRRTA